MVTISPSNMGEYCTHVGLSKYTAKCTPHIIIIGYWICIRKYWVTWFEISVRTCEHRYQTKEPNILVYRFNNLIIICGMEVYQNKATLFREKPINNPQTASQNNGYNITIQYGILLYTYVHIPFV